MNQREAETLFGYFCRYFMFAHEAKRMLCPETLMQLITDGIVHVHPDPLSYHLVGYANAASDFSFVEPEEP